MVSRVDVGCWLALLARRCLLGRAYGVHGLQWGRQQPAAGTPASQGCNNLLPQQQQQRRNARRYQPLRATVRQEHLSHRQWARQVVCHLGVCQRRGPRLVLLAAALPPVLKPSALLFQELE